QEYFLRRLLMNRVLPIAIQCRLVCEPHDEADVERGVPGSGQLRHEPGCATLFRLHPISAAWFQLRPPDDSVGSFHTPRLPECYRCVSDIFTIEPMPIEYRNGTATFALLRGRR